MTIPGKPSDPQNPLGDLEEWDDFVKERYPEPADKQALVGTNPEKTKEQFRDYEAEARSSVREFYRLNHRCLLYTSPSPRDVEESRMPSSA